MAKLTKGRQRVPMEKMQNKNNLLVTFSKRRNGLFKKADELCTLTGANVALLVFSPGQRIYSFGHPSLGYIIDKYLEKDPLLSNASDQVDEAHRNENVDELNEKIIDLENMLEFEKKHAGVLSQMKRVDKQWWQVSMGEPNIQQLERLEKALGSFKKKVDDEVQERMFLPTSFSQQFSERGIFGSTVGTSSPINGPMGVGAFGPSGSSSIVARSIDSANVEIDLNSTPSGSSDFNMPNEIGHRRVRKFF